MRLEFLERLAEAVLIDASMLKISWSIEVESSTITTISV